MILKGSGVSEGVAIGKVFKYKVFSCNVHEAYFEKGREEEYLKLWRDARARAGTELDAIARRMKSDEDDTFAVFSAQREMLFDEELSEMVEDAILSRQAMPDFAVDSAFSEFIAILGQAQDKLIAERTVDLWDVQNRLVRILHGEAESNLSRLPEPVIVVAHDLLPSDTATIDRKNVIGIITEVGGSTSHSAIIARSYRIPAVLSVPEATKMLQNGSLLVLDAMEGTVTIEPTADELAAYNKKKNEFARAIVLADTYIAREARLKSGERVQIGINIGDDKPDAGYEYCDFIGLFRTEFLYMGSDHLPDEEEQLAAYKKVLAYAAGKPVTLRTLDIGGDKELKYMRLPQEANPFLGKRAIRLCFDMPDVFRAQLRASVYGNLRIMFPMVGSIDDIRRAKSFLAECKAELNQRGHRYSDSIQVGIMIEIPSIAAIANLAAEEVDFASIGTNDLCQYLCAADRMNADVGRYYQSFSPAFLRVLSQVITAFEAKGKEISMCGELAGDPKAAILLAGLGLRKFSMNSSGVARVKMRLASSSFDEARHAAKTAMSLATQADVLAYLDQLGPTMQ
jgi:phosphotransferase system enzyme I (PtsI)